MRRPYTILTMSCRQLNYKDIFWRFCFRVQKLLNVFFTTETLFIYFLLGLLTLLDHVRLVLSLCTGWGTLQTETLERFITTTKPFQNYGLNKMCFKNFILLTWKGFTYCLLVGRHCWQCRLLTRGLSCYTRCLSWAGQRTEGLVAILSTSFILVGICRWFGFYLQCDCLLYVYSIFPYNTFWCFHQIWNERLISHWNLSRNGPFMVWYCHSLTTDCMVRGWGNFLMCSSYLL